MDFSVPKGAFRLVKEAARHLLRRPVVGVAAVARTEDGRVLLIRRADTGEWALPGGTCEWGETLIESLTRELAEEAGVREVTIGRLLGVYGGPDRDPRFHAVTIAVECRVETAGLPDNPLEVREVRFFAEDEVPRDLAFGQYDMVAAALQQAEPTVE